jgi:hypothetical protein
LGPIVTGVKVKVLVIFELPAGIGVTVTKLDGIAVIGFVD